MRKLKILVALVAGIAAIAIGARQQQNENRQKDPRTQKAGVQDVDSESLFV